MGGKGINILLKARFDGLYLTRNYFHFGSDKRNISHDLQQVSFAVFHNKTLN